MQAEALLICSCRKLLKMDVLTSETCLALNNEIIKQVTSSWSLFIQLRNYVLMFYLYVNKCVA